jgi:hypothetical protein
MATALRGHANGRTLINHVHAEPWTWHPAPAHSFKHVNAAPAEAELAALRRSVARGLPYGSAAWTQRTARRLGVEYTLRPRGQPKKASAGGKTDSEKS